MTSCSYCGRHLSEKECVCGMLEIVNNECYIGEGIVLVKYSNGGDKNDLSRKNKKCA